MHTHTRPYLSFVLCGDYSERTARREIHCVALTARFHPWGEQHADRFGGNGGYVLNIELDETWAESLARLPGSSEPPMLIDSAAWIGFRAADECQRGRAGAGLIIESLAATLLDECERHARVDRAGASRAALRRAVDLIEAELASPLTLPRIAQAAGLHPTHFARSFRRLTGRTVGDYIRHRRIARAQADLAKEGRRTISSIAMGAGFADHAHLSRCFRQLTGEPPSVYRARATRMRLPPR
jgi:AraC-like DNA-binding protein